AARTVHHFEAVLALTVAFPAHAVLGSHAGAAREQRHFVRNDEARVEADAKLPDQVGVLGLVTGQALEELTRTRLGDRPDVADHLVAGHADAVIGYRDRAGCTVVA